MSARESRSAVARWSSVLATARSGKLLEGLLVACRARWTSGVCGFSRPPLRPVLKHGPRSLTRARGAGQYETREQSEGKRDEIRPFSEKVGASSADSFRRIGWIERKRARWDPKDGELCLRRLKPEETLVEDRSDSDVQIDRPTWV